MPRKTTTSTLQRVRRVLLFGLLVFVGALVGLYVFGRRAPSGPAPAENDQAPAGPEGTIIGEGVRYEVTEDGEKLFDIEADRLLSQESSLYVLEGVKVTMQQEDGGQYSMTASSGTYRLERNEATLKGDVVLKGSSGLMLETQGLELSRRGRLVVSSAPVKITMGDTYRGRANRLEVFFPRNRVVLAGRVVLETAPGVSPSASLRARRAVFFRNTHTFLAEGRVVLRRESDILKARRLSLNFDELDRRILFARANWEVEASLSKIDDEDAISRSEVSGDQLSIVFDEETGDPERLEIGSPDGGAAQLRSIEATGLARLVTADHLWSDFRQGKLRQAQGIGGVTVQETQENRPTDILRRIASESVDALYDEGGSLSTLSLDGAVLYEEGDLRAGGARLTVTGDEGIIDLVGDLAWIQNVDGKLEAPEIRFEKEAGKAFALGGVRAEMASNSTPDLATGEEADQPARVEAATAEWTREPQEFRFIDNVRAWQGENFLVSQTLTMADGELIADGGVRSVWKKRTEPTVEGQDQEEEESPLSIAATRMRYVETQGRLVYEGRASIVQAGRSMSCPLLQLEMNEEQKFERMYCEGGTRISDDDGGSQIMGTAAIYNTEAGKVKIVGEPVRLTQPGGGTISARLMVYDFETAIAEVDSVKDEDADLFMTASEYFQQFGGVPLPLPGDPLLVPPEVPVDGELGAEPMDPELGAEPGVADDEGGTSGTPAETEAGALPAEKDAEQAAGDDEDDGDGR